MSATTNHRTQVLCFRWVCHNVGNKFHALWIKIHCRWVRNLKLDSFEPRLCTNNDLQWKCLLDRIDRSQFCGHERSFCWHRENRRNNRPHNVKKIEITDLLLKVNDYCRGFNEVTSANGNYYQIWSGSKPTINTGPTGLQNFGLFMAFDQISVWLKTASTDNVVATAKANGIRLIVAL